MKKCCSCRRTLEDSCFGKKANSKDGLQSRCKECRSELERKGKRSARIQAKMLERMTEKASEDFAKVHVP